MKSWLSFLLPDDEYKEKKVLYFIAEGAVVLMLALLFIFINRTYVTIIQMDLEFGLFLSMMAFILYVLIRYIFSGMEYTDIATAPAYRRELKHIWWRSWVFAGLFIVMYVIFGNIPSQTKEWIELIILPLVAGFFWFLMSYISLRRSYKKNKELL